MRSLTSAAAIVLVSIAAHFTAVPDAQQPAFRSGARTVAIYATVADKDGRLVPDLQRDSFEVRDNGTPQPITVFSNEIQPISVVMMLDRSGSMRGNVGLVSRAAYHLLRARPEFSLRFTRQARVDGFEKLSINEPLRKIRERRVRFARPLLQVECKIGIVELQILAGADTFAHKHLLKYGVAHAKI